MDEQTIAAAEQWLQQIYDDLMPEYKKDEAILDDRIGNEIKLYSIELQQAVKAVLRKWVVGDDPVRVLIALSLILRLRDVVSIDVLQKLLDDIRMGRRSVETIPYTSTIERIIDRLKAEIT